MAHLAIWPDYPVEQEREDLNVYTLRRANLDASAADRLEEREST